MDKVAILSLVMSPFREAHFSQKIACYALACAAKLGNPITSLILDTGFVDSVFFKPLKNTLSKSKAAPAMPMGFGKKFSLLLRSLKNNGMRFLRLNL